MIINKKNKRHVIKKRDKKSHDKNKTYADMAKMIGDFNPDDPYSEIEMKPEWKEDLKCVVPTTGRNWKVMAACAAEEFGGMVNAARAAYAISVRGVAHRKESTIKTEIEFNGGDRIEFDMSFFAGGKSMPMGEKTRGFCQSLELDPEKNAPNVRTFMAIFAKSTSQLIEATKATPSLYKTLGTYGIPKRYAFPCASRIMPGEVYLKFLTYLVDRDVAEKDSKRMFARDNFENWNKTTHAGNTSTELKAKMLKELKRLDVKE